MKNKTNQMLLISEVLMGAGFAFSLIICCLTIGIFYWGYFDPSIFDKGTWTSDLKSLLSTRPAFYILLGILQSMYTLLFGGLFYTAIKTIKNIDVKKPFNLILHHKIKKLGVIIICIGLIKILCQKIQFVDTPPLVININLLENHFFTLSLGCILIIISLLIKKGIELQEENDLTV